MVYEMIRKLKSTGPHWQLQDLPEDAAKLHHVLLLLMDLGSKSRGSFLIFLILVAQSTVSMLIWIMTAVKYIYPNYIWGDIWLIKIHWTYSKTEDFDHYFLYYLDFIKLHSSWEAIMGLKIWREEVS